ncbi:hypothetical protein SGPA1_10034 [Streptomyces misionensis JCM 4497]
MRSCAILSPKSFTSLTDAAIRDGVHPGHRPAHTNSPKNEDKSEPATGASILATAPVVRPVTLVSPFTGWQSDVRRSGEHLVIRSVWV